MGHWTAQPFRRARTTNATDTSFASKVPTITEPTGDGVISLAKSVGLPVPEALLVVPFGTGDANDVFDMRVIGWRQIGGGNDKFTLWVPCIICQVTATLGAATGIAGSPVLATELFADTIAVTLEGMTRDGELVPSTDAESFTSSGTVVVTSPTNDLIGFFEVCVKGFQKVEFTFDTTTGDPTGVNALVASQC